MYARLVYAELSLYPDTKQRVQPVLVALKSELGKVSGLKSYTLFYDWDRGEVGVFAVWEKKGDEQKAWERIKSKVESAKDVMWRGRPMFKLFDVYEQGPSSKAKVTRAKVTKPKKTSRPPTSRRAAPKKS